MKLYELYIPKLFYLYEGGLKELRARNSFTNMYHCASCSHSFKSLWEADGNYYGRRPADQVIYCPKCGSRFVECTQKDDFSFMSDGDNSPISMKINLDEFKDSLRLTLTGREIVCDENSDYMFHHRLYKESISFNVAKRSAIYKRYVNNKLITNYNLCNVLDTSFDDDTNLRFLNHRHFTNIYANDFKKILKLMREKLAQKLSLKLGHKVKSMYVRHEQGGSYFIKPLVNMAFRLVFVDLENFSVDDYNYIHRKYPFNYGSAAKNFYGLSDSYLSDEKLKTIAKAKDTVSGLIDLVELPNKPTIRKLILSKPFLILKYEYLYKIAHQNIDTFKNLNDVLNTCLIKRNIVTMLEQLDLISQNWGLNYLKTLLRWLSKTKDKPGAEDTIFMISQLEDKTNLWRDRPAPADLHDYLVVAIDRQNNPFREFNINDPICKRLAMQFDSIKFYLPQNSDVLRNAGRELNNCVGTYTDRVFNRETNIVLVSDDIGKLKACIQVSNRNIIQAKLFANKPVSTDILINNEIVLWAEKAGIGYKDCPDINPVAKSLILPQREAV